MRLINDDNVKKIMQQLMGDGFIELIDRFVNNIPTAYDIEKVIEELKYLYVYYDNNYITSEGNELIDRDEAIEIVKKGGQE